MHFRGLQSYARVILGDHDEAVELVQQLFLKIWEKRNTLTVQGPVKGYLYRCVHNESLNYLRQQKTRLKHEEHLEYVQRDEHAQPAERLERTELEHQLQLAMNELPEQCRTIFQMSRFDELKYREIADSLGLSVKTVENQMGKALRVLRLKLHDFLPLIVVFLHNRSIS